MNGPGLRAWFAWLATGLLAVLPLAIFLAARAAAETRVAFVIGIDAYENAPRLTNPVNDAQAIGDALRRLNFEVTELHDPDFRTLSRGLRDFGIRAQKADTALVYYAGHGVQVDGENYLIPADAKLERPRDLAYEALPLSLMLEEVSQASKISIVLLDSCRNNPFIERVVRAMGIAGRAVATTPGMARVDNVPRNTMVVMAAKSGQVAEDGQGHSPFADAVLAHFQIPGLELGLFFRSVRDAVLRTTQNRQEPYVFSSLGAEPFYFYPRPPNRPPVIGPIPPLQVADTAGPTAFGIPKPIDPDLDPLTVRIIGLPRNGEVRVEGRKVALGEAFSVDHFMMGTFRPDGSMSGPIGTMDILVEDGRGGSAMGSLPIVVLPSGRIQDVLQVTAPAKPVPETNALGLPAQASVPHAAAVPAVTAVAPAAPANPPPATKLAMAGIAIPNLSATRMPPDQTAPATSATAPVSLAEARDLALGVPCALIDLHESPSGHQPPPLLVSGPLLPGAAFDSFTHKIEAHGRSVHVATEALDPGHCAAVAVVTDLVRRSRERGTLLLSTPAAPVPIGEPLIITAKTIPGGALYVDLYTSDGSVLHLRPRAVTGGPAETQVRIAATAFGPPGQRLLVAITTTAPLNLAQRPVSESQAAYLPVLQHELARFDPTQFEARADVAVLSIIPMPRPIPVTIPSPPVPASTSHGPAPANPRCQDIVGRVILGESLSDADRTILRTNCGR